MVVLFMELQNLFTPYCEKDAEFVLYFNYFIGIGRDIENSGMYH